MMDYSALKTNFQEDILNYELIEAEVQSVSWGKKGTYGKSLHLKYIDHPDHEVVFRVSRSACVAMGDTVYSKGFLSESSSMEQDLLLLKCQKGFTQLSPIYSVETHLQIGDLCIPITIKEINQQDEYDGYISLTQYHYRNKTLFGRHAPLVAVSNHPLLPKVIGYIELTSAFFVNTPRRTMLDEPTRLNGFAWESWTKDVMRERIPLFVRIARCVVHPELRAMGLGRILIQNAADFARTHWQSAYWKPYFLEISADMLRYIPFAEKAGMIFVGETEGNLKRIAKDLNYLKSNEKRLQKEIFKGDVFGILDTKLSQLQKATLAINDSDEQNMRQFITNHIKHPTLDGWAKLAGVLSLPKPHYMMGLNKESMDLITQRSKDKKVPPSSAHDSQEYIDEILLSRIQDPISLKNVSYQAEFYVTRTKITHLIERAFEISLDNLIQPIFKNLSLDILPGEIVVITGLSGTGKTTLLKLLAGTLIPNTGKISIPNNANIGQLSELSISKPLIEVIGKEDTGRGIYWLGIVGLSEPTLYVKPFPTLSAGQKYRAMIAQLLVQGSNLWLIDEFCENLDVVNTQLLSKKVASLARKVGATVVIASSDATRFVNSLTPDKVLILKGAPDSHNCEMITGIDFINLMGTLK